MANFDLVYWIIKNNCKQIKFLTKFNLGCQGASALLNNPFLGKFFLDRGVWIPVKGIKPMENLIWAFGLWVCCEMY